MTNQASTKTSDNSVVDFYGSLVVTTAEKARKLEADLLELQKRMLTLERKLMGAEAGQEWQQHLDSLRDVYETDR